jgi:hypothetical protein
MRRSACRKDRRREPSCSRADDNQVCLRRHVSQKRLSARCRRGGGGQITIPPANNRITGPTRAAGGG